MNRISSFPIGVLFIRLCFVVLGCSWPGFLQAADGASTAQSGVVVKKDIPYLEEGRAEMMDAYLPPPHFQRPVPAVVLIHGGGWRSGSKSATREKNIGFTLAENGYAVFSINYLLATGSADEQKVFHYEKIAWPQNLYDCKSAVRFLRKSASTFGLDANRIAVMGCSAGGHLALLVGATARVPEINRGGLYTEQSNEIACIIDFYGLNDVTAEWEGAFAGGNEAETKENVRQASPPTYYNKDTPPVLIVHGTGDRLLSVDISRKLAASLEKLGIPHQYVEIPGAPHRFHLQPKEMDLRPVVLEFLGKYLGKPALLSGVATSEPTP